MIWLPHQTDAIPYKCMWNRTYSDSLRHEVFLEAKTKCLAKTHIL